ESSMEVDATSLEIEIREMIEPIFNLPLGELHLGKVLVKVASHSAARGAPVKRELFLFFRAIVALEAFGKTLDPDFEFLKEASHYSKELQLPSFSKEWISKES